MIRNPMFVTDPEAVVQVETSANVAPTDNSQNDEPRTVMDIFDTTVRKYGSHPALLWKTSAEQDYQRKTYQQYFDDCISFAKSLIMLDISLFRVVNILGFNSPEWFIANNGTILAGCISAGIYSSNSPDSCRHCSNSCDAMVVVLEGNEQLRKYSEIALDLHSVKTIVVWGEPIESEISQLFPEQISVYSWDEFIRLGETIDRSQVETRWGNVRPGNCATVIYTSGTTGPPKAVMISHDNLTWTSKQICRGGYMDLNEEDKIVSYLPLSHIAAQLIDIHCIMHIGGAVYFAQRDALQGSLLNTMKEVRPTFFFGVPRVYEKMQTKLNQQFRKTNILAKLLHNASTSVGKARSANIQVDGNESYPWGYFLAKKLYLDYVKSALGLENCKGCYCAAAPISEDTLWFFAGLDIPIYEVFGLSECTGPHTISGQGQWKIGYCGRPIPGTDTKIDPESGEMRIRGRHVFMGYMHMPQETREIFDESGYIRSGDIAEVHASGLYKIIGRTKDLIVTAGGENVSPTLLENTIKKELEAVSNCIVIGDHRKYLTMLISLQVQIDKSTGNFTDELSHSAQAIGNSFGSNATTYTSAKEDPKWAQYIEQGIAKANKKAPSNAQKIRKWRWLPQELSEQTGETTATQKVKRNVVISNHQDLVDQMYADSDK